MRENRFGTAVIAFDAVAMMPAGANDVRPLFEVVPGLGTGLVLCRRTYADARAAAGPQSPPQMLGGSDLVSGVYEGGLKTWEGAIDLANYVRTHRSELLGPGSPAVLRVLELGCGSALPTIALATLAEVTTTVVATLQDYNEMVLEHVTAPNVHENLARTNGRHRVTFLAGPWSSFRGPESTYDIILSSETIYNPLYVPALLDIIEQYLAVDGGKAYIAAKSFYFGVGGSTQDFVELVRTRGRLSAKTVEEITSGGVMREIILLEHNRKDMGSSP